MKPITLTENWAEAGGAILLLLGLMVSILLSNEWVVYLVVLLAGALAGRGIYIRRFKEPVFPFVLMSMGFLLGYLLGTFWASRFWTATFFIVGLAVSYYLHMKGILVIFKSREFIR